MRASKVERIEDPDLELLAGWLTGEPEVVKVLGPRSANLAFAANVLQVSMRAESSALTVSRDSFRLRLPSGETLQPLPSEHVVAAVSLPVPGPQSQPQPTSTSISGTTAAYWAAYLAVIQLSMAGLGAAIEKAGAEKYRDAARPDVQKKTMLPRWVAPGEQLDILLVYLPKTGKVSCFDALTVEAKLSLEGRSWEKALVIDCK